ncbi:MAG: diguanylate cyclase [Clostridiales bacterium]|jgi:diguanylate cyclase (GGDEF)-like protein/PAS domain S-box-containing protein|nr:diguanylate cyclase [Clostridiales bacterium]
MKAEIMRKILQQIPLGCAIHKLIEEQGGNKDYIFLDVNPTFEKLTGLTKKAIVGKGVKEVLYDTELRAFDWIGLYEGVTLSGQTQEVKQYLESLKRWYKITAFAIDKEHFITVFQDVTKEVELENALGEKESRIDDLAVEPDAVFNERFEVTDRERYREELYCEKELYRITLLSIGEGVVTTDQAGRISMLNPAAQRITGWSEDEVKGKPFDEVFKLINEDTGEMVENPIAEALRTGSTVSLDKHTALVTKEGCRVLIADSVIPIKVAPIKDMKGQTVGAVMVFRDITQEKVWQEKFNSLNWRDPLTGLYNRRFVEEEFARWQASSRAFSIAVIVADINGLKLVNDMFGVQEGDNLLKRAARILRESCRKTDIVARWDGDEFIILLPRITARAAEKIVERIKNRCLQEKEGEVQLSLAIGYAVKRKPLESLNQVVKEAEEMMHRTKLMEEKSYRNAVVSSILMTLFAKSTETEEHAERLKSYCLAIGRKMRLSSKELDELALLAVLHDIGKVGIRESILQKPGPLTAEEWEEMKKHPEIGWRIAKGISELVHIAEYILCHHERWDGHGYPRGLKGEEIPLLCRILAVVDAYDAMTSDRVYRKAMSRERALAEIKRNAGTQFDPHVVETFLDLLAKEDTEKINKVKPLV